MRRNIEGLHLGSLLGEKKKGIGPFMQQYGPRLALVIFLLSAGMGVKLFNDTNLNNQQNKQIQGIRDRMAINGFGNLRKKVGEFVGADPEDCEPAIRGKSAGFVCRVPDDTILQPWTPTSLNHPVQ